MNMTIDPQLIHWPRWSKYEIVTTDDYKRYIRPSKDAVVNSMHANWHLDTLVTDAVNIGMMVLGQKDDDIIEKAVLDFVHRHGLLGIMTALPNAPDYMECDLTFLPKNRFIRDRYMKTDAYQKIFFPFHDLQLMRKKIDGEPDWDDPKKLSEWSLVQTFADQPRSVMMTALKEYAEPYNWVVDQFKDWAYMVSCCYFFYKNGIIEDNELRLSLQDGMEAYGGVTPSYIILLRDKPTLWWHFHSLHQYIHLSLSFMLADEKNPLRMCKHCKKIYISQAEEDWFCSEKCRTAFDENEKRLAHLLPR